MLTAVLRCAQPLNKQDMHSLQIFFDTTPLCHAYKNFYLSIKDLEIMSPPFRVGRHIVFPVRPSVPLSVCHKLCRLYNLKTA